MSEKNRDEKNRWRNKIVAFRMSEREAEQLNKFVKISGMNKQDYLIHRVMQRDIVIYGNSKTNHGLKIMLSEVKDELQRLSPADEIESEILDIIAQISATLIGLEEKEKSSYPGR